MAISNKENPNQKNLKPTVSTANTIESKSIITKEPIVYGKLNYQIMGAGVVFIIIGMLLMTGGAMPSTDVWDESIIYSFRRITLAPIFILIGLGLQIWGIFKKDPNVQV